jgi:hypothetical protein
MEVVCHHVGSPRNNITAQNDRTIFVLKPIDSGLSGGGDLAVVVETASGGALEDASIVAARSE